MGCFPACSGVLFRRLCREYQDDTITLLLTRYRTREASIASYHCDNKGRYDAQSNRFRYPQLSLEDDGSAGDVVRLVERGEHTGAITGCFSGRLEVEGRMVAIHGFPPAVLS